MTDHVTGEGSTEMALSGFSSICATAHNIVKAHAVLWLMCVNCYRETKADPATSRSAISLRYWSGRRRRAKSWWRIWLSP
jgi:hypothetical protein